MDKDREDILDRPGYYRFTERERKEWMEKEKLILERERANAETLSYAG